VSEAGRTAANHAVEASFDEDAHARIDSLIPDVGDCQPRAAGDFSIMDSLISERSGQTMAVRTGDAPELSGKCHEQDPRQAAKVASSTSRVGRPSDLKRRLSRTKATPTTKRRNIAGLEVERMQNQPQDGSYATSPPHSDHGKSESTMQKRTYGGLRTLRIMLGY